MSHLFVIGKASTLTLGILKGGAESVLGRFRPTYNW
jgi:hypothetical protein